MDEEDEAVFAMDEEEAHVAVELRRDEEAIGVYDKAQVGEEELRREEEKKTKRKRDEKAQVERMKMAKIEE